MHRKKQIFPSTRLSTRDSLNELLNEVSAEIMADIPLSAGLMRLIQADNRTHDYHSICIGGTQS